MRVSLIASEVSAGLRRNLTMTLAAMLTTAIALALFGVALGIRAQMNEMKGFWYGKIEVSIFLCSENSDSASCADGAVTQAQRDAIQSELQQMPQVERVYYESQQEAFAHFKEQFKNSAITDNITASSLPESFRVKLANPEQDYQIVSSAFQGRPGVDQVVDQRAVLQRLFDLLNGFQVGSLVVAAVALVAMVLLIVVVIRVAAFNRRRETGIMRLVGASNFTIQAPFLIEAALAAVVGGLIASVFLLATKIWFVDGLLARDIRFTTFIGWPTVWAICLVITLTGIVVSAVTAFFTLLKYLRV